MTTTAIRQKLSAYLKVANDKKVKAIYALVEDEIEPSGLEYSNDLKEELDKRFADYKKTGKMITGVAAKKQVNKLLQSTKR